MRDWLGRGRRNMHTLVLHTNINLPWWNYHNPVSESECRRLQLSAALLSQFSCPEMSLTLLERIGRLLLVHMVVRIRNFYEVHMCLSKKLKLMGQLLCIVPSSNRVRLFGVCWLLRGNVSTKVCFSLNPPNIPTDVFRNQKNGEQMCPPVY